MKQFIQNFLTITALLLLTVSNTWAQEGRITISSYQLDGQPSTEAAAGTVVPSISEDGKTATLTVTPKDGNYFEFTNENITVYKAIPGNLAQTRDPEAPGFNVPVELTLSGDANLNGATVLTFNVTDENYTYSVTVNFQTRKSMTGSAITLEKETYPYTGEEIKPTITKVVLADGKTELASTDYTVAYANNINVPQEGDPNPTMTLTGIGKYKDEVSANFTIEKAEIAPEVIIEGWTYGDEAKAPSIKEGTNPGEGGVSFEYKEKDASNDTYTGDVPTNAGNYIVKATIAETPNYKSGTATAEFTISPKTIANVNITLTPESFVFNGKNQKPEVSVKDGDTDLILDTDYTLTNDGGTNVDEYSVTVTGKGNYDSKTTASKKYNITVLETTPTVVLADTETPIVYDGTEKKPAVKVTVTIAEGGNPTELTTDDYDVAYSGNVNASENTAKATVTLKRNYKGSAETTFTIAAKNIADETVTVEDIQVQEYKDGSEIKPKVVVNDGTTVLKENQDYTLSYSNNKDVASADDGDKAPTVTITGMGNYQGSRIKTFTISLAAVVITGENQETTYNGSAQTYTAPTVEKGSVVVNYYANADDRSKQENALDATAIVNAGTYYVQLTQGDERYTSEPVNVTFTILQLELTGAVVTLDKTELPYNGEQQTVNVTKVMVGTIEVPAESYEVSGNTQTEAGEHVITVKARTKDENGNDYKNNFKGSCETKFKITLRTISKDALGLTGDRKASTYYNENEDFELPDGVVAYIITGTNGSKLIAKRISYIPKGVAVLTELAESSEEAVDNGNGNILQGTSAEKDVDDITGGDVYVLYNGKFEKCISGKIPANRCYLVLNSAVVPAGTRSFTIEHGEGYGTTAIHDVQSSIINLQSDQWYDLQGHRIQKPTKAGLYINNGKKVVINNK